MALYGQMRDVSMIRFVNRELMQKIISQQCVYYKYNLTTTKVNMYGEAAEGRYFSDPTILFALISREDQIHATEEFGVEFKWDITFKFLRDDLVEANVFPQVGDVVMWDNGYWEIDNPNVNQYFVGKNPDFPNEIKEEKYYNRDNFGEMIKKSLGDDLYGGDIVNDNEEFEEDIGDDDIANELIFDRKEDNETSVVQHTEPNNESAKHSTDEKKESIPEDVIIEKKDESEKINIDVVSEKATKQRELFYKTKFSVVVETEAEYNEYHITEKTLKCLVMGHPFVVMGTPKFLQFLHKLVSIFQGAFGSLSAPAGKYLDIFLYSFNFRLVILLKRLVYPRFINGIFIA